MSDPRAEARLHDVLEQHRGDRVAQRGCASEESMVFSPSVRIEVRDIQLDKTLGHNRVRLRKRRFRVFNLPYVSAEQHPDEESWESWYLAERMFQEKVDHLMGVNFSVELGDALDETQDQPPRIESS